MFLGIINAKFNGDQGVRLPATQETYYRVNVNGMDILLSEPAVMMLFEPYHIEAPKETIAEVREVVIPKVIKKTVKKAVTK